MFQGTGALAFNAAFYLQQNPDVFQAIQNGTFQGSALDHFVQFGQFEGRDPNQFFDTEYYLANNTDVLVAIADPANPSVVSAFQHFVDFGSEEGVVRAPSAVFATFNAQTYLSQNPDLQAAFGNLTGEALEDRLFQHFVEFGVNENRPGSGVTVDGGLPGQSFTLTAGIDTLTGTANNDLFIANPVTNAAGDNVDTLGGLDDLNGGAGTDTLRATLLGGTYAPTLTSIENVEVRAFGETTVDLVNATGVESLTVFNSKAEVSFLNVGDVDTFNISGDAAGNDVTFAGVTVDEATVNVSNYGTKDGSSAFINLVNEELVDGEGIETLNLNVTNANFEIDSDDFNDLVELNIVATGENVIDVLDADTVVNATVSGSGSVDLSASDFTSDLKSFDASGNSGGVQADFSGRDFGPGATPTALTVTGGSGGDRFVFGTLDKGVTIDGGAGFDTVAVTAANLTAPAAAAPFNALTGVERVEFVGSGATTLQGNTFTNASITNLLFNNIGDVTILNAGSARTYEFGSDFSGDAALQLKSAATVLNVDLLGGQGEGTDGAAVNSLTVNYAAGTAATAVTTLNIDSLGSETTGANAIGDLTLRNGSTIVITGDADLNAGQLVASATGGAADAGFTVDASAFTADLVIGSSVDGDDITLGAGEDVVFFETGTSGEVVTPAGGVGELVNFDVITGFTAGTDGDVLAATAAITADAAYTGLTADQQAAITGGASTLLQAFNLAADAVDGSGWTAFTFGGETYAAFTDGVEGFGEVSTPIVDADGEPVLDAEGNPTFEVDGGEDLIVQLNGITIADLEQGNFAGGFGGL